MMTTVFGSRISVSMYLFLYGKVMILLQRAESVYNQSLHFKRIVKHVGEPMSHAESVASSAVRTAVNVNAAMIVAFTSTGGAPRLITKYRPPVPVLAVVIPRLKTNSLKWTLTGTLQVPQALLPKIQTQDYVSLTETTLSNVRPNRVSLVGMNGPNVSEFSDVPLLEKDMQITLPL
ncbi:unnamed protein product, partial [Vitis vinifera]|uniref:Pyruvate kinase C-terminal domain-containing protein n=1 Tax=Vitis vinifera TaxID=29760 RepID=D7TIM6_VITVI